MSNNFFYLAFIKCGSVMKYSNLASSQNKRKEHEFFYGWWNFVNRKEEVVRNQRHLFVNNPSSGFKISKLSIRTVPSFGLHLFLHSAWVGRFSGFELWFFISFCSFSLVKLYGITALILSYFSSVKRHFLVMVVVVALTT